jgi:hypothetical protein
MPSKFSKVIFGSCQVDFGIFRHPDEKRLPVGEFSLELPQGIDMRIDLTAQHFFGGRERKYRIAL